MINEVDSREDYDVESEDDLGESTINLGTFRDIPNELIQEILLNTKAKDIPKLCQTNKYFRDNVCRSEFGGLWRQLYQRDISSESPNLTDRSKSWRDEYFRVMTEFNNIRPDSKNLPDKDDPDYNIIAYAEKIDAQVDYAVKNRYINLLLHLLENHPHLSTAFNSAAKYGYLDVIKQLIDKGYSPYSQTVFTAAKNGHQDIVDYLLELPDDSPMTFSKEQRLNSAMKGAAEGNQEVLLIHLIDYNTNNYPEELDRNINDALWSASKADNTNIINHLLVNGGNLNAALMGAATGGHLNLVENFLDQGANDINGAFLDAVHTDQLPVVKFFRENYPDQIDINEGLLHAAGWDSLQVLNYLIGLGATNKNEALLQAINAENYKSALTLILNGANNFYDAIMACLEFGFMSQNQAQKLIDILIDKALLNGRRLTETQLTQISVKALESGYPETVRHLLNLDFDPLYDASYYGNLAQVKILLEKGSSFPFNLNQALINASAKGNFEIVEELLRRGAGNDYYTSRLKNPEKELTGQQALNSAVEGAAYFGHKDIVEELLQYGADIHSALDGALRDSDFRPLNYQLIEDLIREGLESGELDINKVLRQAASTNDLPLVKLVIRYGATDIDGAMDWAVSRYNPNWELIEYLLQRGANRQRAIDKSLNSATKQFIRIKSAQIDAERSRYRRSRGK